MCTGEMYMPALPHQSKRRNRLSLCAVHLIPQQLSGCQRKLGIGWHELKTALTAYTIQWSKPLEYLVFSNDNNRNLENQFRCSHPWTGDKKNQPKESLPSVQHWNFKLSAPLDKIDNYIVMHYPQTFGLCTAEVNPDKASVSPSNF